MHIFMNGLSYREAVRAMKENRMEETVRKHLGIYRDFGIGFLRDGGDPYGASLLAKKLAPSYGLDYRTPGFAIHKKGHYGRIVGKAFETKEDYRSLLQEAADRGADFIKLMLSGLVDFSRASLTEASLPSEEITAMVTMAHEAGFSVMAHVNGDEAVEAAAKAGVESVEHGYFMGDRAVKAMAEAGTVYVPTFVTVANLRGRGRFPEDKLREVFKWQAQALRKCWRAGVQLARGSDAGAYGVLHGQGLLDEERILMELLTDEKALGGKGPSETEVRSFLENGERLIRKNFRRR